MKLIQDTREQTPLDFSGFEYITETVVEYLNVGDYTVEYSDGYRPPVIFERKSIGDLYGTLGKGYERFKKMLARADKQGISIILIIEGSLSKVAKGHRYSRVMKGYVVVKRLFSMKIKHCEVVFCKDRVETAKYIYEYFCAIGRLKGKKIKKGVKNGQ